MKWEIDPHTKCPGGSGLQFRKCCRGNEGLIGKAFELSKKGDCESAERAWRAELTRYIGWVFKHTLILLKHLSGPPLELMTIDVGALEAFAERLAFFSSASSLRANSALDASICRSPTRLGGTRTTCTLVCATLWLFNVLAVPDF
ncbi:MAG TPA: hypothetical protein VN836_09965 [Verrucomicrobiae bacterium]|nr:hypothetical protein [Verrucomicrobiae bacterium]